MHTCIDSRGVDRFLGPEVVVERALGDAGEHGDVGHGRASRAVLLHRAHRPVEHCRTGALHRVAGTAVHTAFADGRSGRINAHAATTGIRLTATTVPGWELCGSSTAETFGSIATGRATNAVVARSGADTKPTGASGPRSSTAMSWLTSRSTSARETSRASHSDASSSLDASLRPRSISERYPSEIRALAATSRSVRP